MECETHTSFINRGWFRPPPPFLQVEFTVKMIQCLQRAFGSDQTGDYFSHVSPELFPFGQSKIGRPQTALQVKSAMQRLCMRV